MDFAPLYTNSSAANAFFLELENLQAVLTVFVSAYPKNGIVPDSPAVLFLFSL